MKHTYYNLFVVCKSTRDDYINSSLGVVYQLYHGWLTLQLLLLAPPFCKERLNNCVILPSLPPSLLVSYPDPTVRNDDHRLQYDITCHTVSDDHRYVHMGLGTRLPPSPLPPSPDFPYKTALTMYNFIRSPNLYLPSDAI